MQKDFATPRRARMYISGLPYHVVQRGNNREACFFEIEDYQFYLDLLQQLLYLYGVHLHAYVLMTNHVHMLMTAEEKDSISNMTRVLGSRFAQYMNRKYQRTGTLWEGRHKPSVVDSENYLLKCYRYIEVNPVTVNMEVRPEEYQWSSHCCNAWGDLSPVIEPHSEYIQLGKTVDERCNSYRDLFSASLSNEDVQFIRKATHYCQPMGNDRFRLQKEEKIGRPVGMMGIGRPRKMVKK